VAPASISGYRIISSTGEASEDRGTVVYAVAATTLVAYDFPTERPRRLTPDERAQLAVITGPPVDFRRRRAATP